MMQWAYRLPDRLISVSHWVACSVQEKINTPIQAIDVIYDGIELEKLDVNADGSVFRKKYNITDNEFAVGLIGLLIPWKGQEIFLDAAKILRKTIPHFKMLVIGGTPDECKAYEAALRQRVIDEQLDDIVIFTGHVTKMEPVYNGLDIIVSASTSPEPLGTVVIEALAMGRPLIGPNHGGAAEMMEHEITGLLFIPKNAVSLAEQIERYFKDIELRKTLGENARQHALKTFAVETHAEKVQAVYDNLLNGHQ
jgi:glycosyltransferase involved in cell wall biosynthesis